MRGPQAKPEPEKPEVDWTQVAPETEVWFQPKGGDVVPMTFKGVSTIGQKSGKPTMLSVVGRGKAAKVHSVEVRFCSLVKGV
jgi:hypothetical protein